MKIVDVIEKDSDTAKNTLKNIIKRHQQIVSKFLEGVVQFAHDPVYKFLLWLFHCSAISLSINWNLKSIKWF